METRRKLWPRRAARAVVPPRPSRLGRLLRAAPLRLVGGLFVCSVVPFLALARLRPWLAPSHGPWLPTLLWVGATALLLGCYSLLYRFWEGRRVVELELAPAPRDLFLGLLSGAAAVGVAMVLLLGVGCYRVVDLNRPVAVPTIVALLGFYAAFEEVIFRGILYRILEGSAGTVAALLVSSTVFAWVHVNNPGATLVSTLSVALAGVALALLFALTRRLWLPIAFHLGWNAAQALAGADVSGNQMGEYSAFFRLSVRGEEWLTGGEFGPEGSVVTATLLLALASGLYGAVASRGGFVPLPRPRWAAWLRRLRAAGPVTPS